MSTETPRSASPPGARARAELAGSRFADVRWVGSTGSTNTDAMALARDGEPEGIVLVADHQAAGRGRLGRTWQAPPGASLLVSVLLRLMPGWLFDRLAARAPRKPRDVAV